MSKMMANSSENYDFSKLINVFHSILFEQMADIEAISNNSESPKTSKERYKDAYEKLYPQFFPIDGISSNNQNVPWNHQEIFKKFLGPGKYKIMSNETMVGDTNVDLIRKTTEQHEDPCHLITNEEMITYENVAFFLELVVQPIFICIGFVFNTIAINVLRR